MIPDERALRLLAIIESWFPYTANPEAVTIEEMALAGVVRCARLLDGMVTLRSQPDLVGNLARSSFETWVTAIYILLGGDEAFERVMAGDDHEQRKMCRRFLELDHSDNSLAKRLERDPEFLDRCRELLDRPKPTASGLDLWAMSLKVQRMLVDLDDPNSGYPTMMYANLHATESYTATHGGLGALKQYYLNDGEFTGTLDLASWASEARADHMIELMTAALLVLAAKVGDALELDTAML
jgi:hypothetical protein